MAFVANGAVLPRKSGADDLPMPARDAVKFASPPSLEVEIALPNRKSVRGMGLRRGITLVVGGGFHGKSTLLQALEVGCFNHVPGDGREFVVADPSCVKVLTICMYVLSWFLGTCFFLVKLTRREKRNVLLMFHIWRGERRGGEHTWDSIKEVLRRRAYSSQRRRRASFLTLKPCSTSSCGRAFMRSRRFYVKSYISLSVLY